MDEPTFSKASSPKEDNPEHPEQSKPPSGNQEASPENPPEASPENPPEDNPVHDQEASPENPPEASPENPPEDNPVNDQEASPENPPEASPENPPEDNPVPDQEDNPVPDQEDNPKSKQKSKQSSDHHPKSKQKSKQRSDHHDNPDQGHQDNQPYDQGSTDIEPTSSKPRQESPAKEVSGGHQAHQSAGSTVFRTAGSPKIAASAGSPKHAASAGSPKHAASAGSLRPAQHEQENEPVQEQHPWHIWYGILAIIAVFMMMYIIWDFEQMHELRFKHAQTKLAVAISQFPKTPQQYNALQLEGYYANFWRRFNFRNISLTVGSVLTSLALAHWHRQKRVAFQSRKTLQFWLGTMTAGFMATVWGLYMMQQAEKQKLTMRALKANPMLRSGIYLAMILISGTMLYCYRRQFKEKVSKHHHHHHRHRTPKSTAKMVNIM